MGFIDTHREARRDTHLSHVTLTTTPTTRSSATPSNDRDTGTTDFTINVDMYRKRRTFYDLGMASKKSGT